MASAAQTVAAATKFRLPPLPSPAELLRLYRLKALKQMSQNFLLDPRICKRLVKCAGELSSVTASVRAALSIAKS